MATDPLAKYATNIKILPMLAASGFYDAAATPETGRETVERGEHAVF